MTLKEVIEILENEYKRNDQILKETDYDNSICVGKTIQILHILKLLKSVDKIED